MLKPAAFLLLAMLCACSTSPRDTAATPGTVADQAECLQRGGEWRQLGRLPVEQCLLPTGDAGKACSDADQCEGLCVAPEGTVDGARTGGTCSADTNRFGCRQILRDGTALTMCVD